MPRSLRIQDAGYLHHVICVGNNHQNIFKSHSDFQQYISFLEKARKKFPVNIYNYVFMDNQLHMLVEAKEEGSLSKFMEEGSKSYARYFNRRYDHSGHVFSGRYKSFLVQKERYFFICCRYIDLNPVKANVVSDPKQYAWSGYSALACGKDSPLKLDFHNLYKELGANSVERQIAYRALVMNYQGEEIDLLNRRAGVLGSPEFKSKIKGNGK